MYEELLEDIAQKNALRGINPWCKLAAGLGAIMLCLLSAGFIAPLFIAITMSVALIVLARIDPRTYAELFGVPLVFAVMSVAAIILIAGGDGVLWSTHPLPWLTLSVTRESINEGVFVFCRVLGGTSALCFIALTTPMTDLFVILRRCGVPVVLIELSMIIYRTIFILMDQVVQIQKAQVMRLGYSSLRESIHSCAMLCGAVFIGSWDAGEDLVRAMDARCYDGRFVILGETRPLHPGPVLAAGAFLVTSAIVVVFTAGITAI